MGLSRCQTCLAQQSETRLHPRPRQSSERARILPSSYLPCLFPSFPFPSRSPSPFPFPFSFSFPPPLSPFHHSFPLSTTISPHFTSSPTLSPTLSSLPCVCPSSPPSLWLYLSFFLKSHSRAMRNLLRSCPTNMSNKAMLIVQPPYPLRRSRSPRSQFPHSPSPPQVCDTETRRAVSPSSDLSAFQFDHDHPFSSAQPLYVLLPPSRHLGMAPLVRSGSAIGMGRYPPIDPYQRCSPSSATGQSMRICNSWPSSA
jgi:hypothetical protein